MYALIQRHKRLAALVIAVASLSFLFWMFSAAIKKDRSFYENGSFSLSRYREILQRIGLTPEEYELRIKKNLSVQKLLNMLRGGVYLTAKELDVRRYLLSSLLSGKLYLLTPQRVKLSYKPTEEELRRYYEENRERFRRKSERVFRVWEVKDKALVQKLYSALKRGELPSGGKRVKKDGKLPDLVKREMERLSERNPYTVVKAEDRYFILHLEQVSPEELKPFEEVKEEIEEIVAEERKRELLKSKAFELAEDLRKGKETDLKPVFFENSKASEFKQLFGIEERELIRVVFSAERVFGPYRTAGGYAVVYIEKRTPPAGPPEDGLREALLGEKFESLMDVYVDHLVNSLGLKVNEELIK